MVASPDALLDVQVADVSDAAVDIRSFLLRRAGAGSLPDYAPGSHIDVHIDGGLVRQYSLCNVPGDTDAYRICVKREPASRGGSKAMHERVKVGDTLKVSAPRNNFQLDSGSGNVILLAGGIGITPFVSMAQQLSEENRPFALHYFTRSAAHTAFREYLSQPRYVERVRLHYGLDADAVRVRLEELLRLRERHAQLYLCGPRLFMDAVKAVAAANWPREAIHLEYFSPEPAAGVDRPFIVRLARRGGDYPVAGTQSIVEALGAHGIAIPTSCEQGVCGTCLTGVLAGEPEHRDVFLTDEEKADNNKMTCCVSRAKGDLLVLDL